MWSLSKYELLTEYCKLRNCYGVWVEEKLHLADDSFIDTAYDNLLAVFMRKFPIQMAYKFHACIFVNEFILVDEEKEMDEIFAAMCDPSVKEYFFTVTCGPNGGLDES
jgi:hypothetical protein